jgi:hypothetical protein
MTLEFIVQFTADRSLSPHFPIDRPPVTLPLYGAFSLTQDFGHRAELWI